MEQSGLANEKRFALLIDADNISVVYLPYILDELTKYGTITYKRIYGDWTTTLHSKWKKTLLDNSIIPIQQFSYTQGKNATDHAMIIDAMDILYTNSVDGFCIASSDSDFTRLAARIRESGLTVIGMGENKTPSPFRKACNRFTILENLIEATGPSAEPPSDASPEHGEEKAPRTLSKKKAEHAVCAIVTDNLNEGRRTLLSEVGNRLLARYPDFDVRNYGTNQLMKLLAEFKSIEVVHEGDTVIVQLANEKKKR